MQINTQRTTTRTKGRVKAWPANDSEMDMCYTSRLPVSTQINKDLVNLCEKVIGSEDFHVYFMSLPANSKCKDNIPEGLDQDDSDSDVCD